MNGQATSYQVTFKITRWDAAPDGEPADGPRLERVTIDKLYGGALEATSRGTLLTCMAEGGSAGYVASERVTGRLDGRSGSFVLQHGATHDAESGQDGLYGWVVPGSGTGELRGLSGTARFGHERLMLDVSFGRSEQTDS